MKRPFRVTLLPGKTHHCADTSTNFAFLPSLASGPHTSARNAHSGRPEREDILAGSKLHNHAGGQLHSRNRTETDLYARFRAPLERYFAKRVFEKGDVDDLVQEVFTRLLARSERVQMEEPEAYVFQIAANLLRDRSRRDIVRKSASGRFAEENGDSFEAITPERVLLAKQQVAKLKDALAELPERVRFVFLLHRYEGMKYREIAQHLGISVSSVEKYMMQAK